MPRPAPHFVVDRLTPCQEAAVLYAQEHAEDAVALLEQAIVDEPDDRDRWLLLFALHRTQYASSHFDALALRYRRQFGDQAPDWLPDSVLCPLAPEMHPGGAAYVELLGELSDPSPEHFLALHRRCAQHSVVHLDATRVLGLQSSFAQRLSALLRALAGDGTGVLITGGERIVDALRGRLDDDPTLEDYWTLLLDLYQLQDRQQQFESAALEFALHTGVDQPSWRASILPVLHIHPVQEKRSVPRYSGPEARALNRIIVSPRDVQLLDLENYARSRQYVNVELSGLLRLSPAAAQALVRLFNPWLQRGKTVRLIRPQLLVEALLSTLCLDPRVELIRAQLS